MRVGITIAADDGGGNAAAIFVGADAEWVPLDPSRNVQQFRPARLLDLTVGTEQSGWRFIPFPPPPTSLLALIRWAWIYWRNNRGGQD